VRDARPCGRCAAPWPLVLFSHGSGAFRASYVYWTEFLASHGFVVAACDHLGSARYSQVDDHSTCRASFIVTSSFALLLLAGRRRGRDAGRRSLGARADGGERAVLLFFSHMPEGGGHISAYRGSSRGMR
jgi:hypothetical protein